MKSHIYQIDTEIGFITVSKKEYYYQKERVINDLCPEDEIRINGQLKQYSKWKEETIEYPNEIVTSGYRQVIKCGTIEVPEVLSSFEQELVNNKNDHYAVIRLVDSFLKSR